MVQRKGLTLDVVEGVNEIEHASLEILERGKACVLEQPSRDDGEPDLDLVEPRAVSWGVDEADPMRGILQERAARWLRLEDTGLAFDAEIFLNAAPLGHPFDERGRAVGIKLIGPQYPTRIGIGFDSGCKVGSEIRFGSRRCPIDRASRRRCGGQREISGLRYNQRISITMCVRRVARVGVIARCRNHLRAHWVHLDVSTAGQQVSIRTDH